LIIGVTGGSGYIGKRLIEILLQDNHTVRSISRNKQSLVKKNLSWFQADIRKTEVQREFIKGLDVLINCVGVINNEKDFFPINTELLYELANIAKENGIKRFIQISSLGVYDTSSKDKVINENSKLGSTNKYEKTKILSDKFLMGSNFPFEIVILRPSAVFSWDMPNLSLKQLVNAIRKKHFFYIGRPNAILNYIHLDKLCAVINSLVRAPIPKKTMVCNLNDSILIERLVEIVCQEYKTLNKFFRVPLVLGYLIFFFLKIIEKISSFKSPLTISRLKLLSSKLVYKSDPFITNLILSSYDDLEISLRKTIKKWK